MPTVDKERDDAEFKALLEIFEEFTETDGTEEDKLEVVGKIMSLRARHLLLHAFDGFGISFEEALKLLRNKKDLSELDASRRNVIVAAVDNLIDFAVAEEYQMLVDTHNADIFQSSDEEEENDDEEEEEIEEPEIEEDEELDEDEVMAIFMKYNKRYALVENKDVEYAMIMAATLAAIKPKTYLTYMTMGDERVRPWHLQYEGFTAPKEEFPEWLIPPIEHMCRCYLDVDVIENTVQAKASQKKLEMPEWFNPTFKESVALGGRIFSDEHPYFQIFPKHNKALQKLAELIKEEFYNG